MSTRIAKGLQRLFGLMFIGFFLMWVYNWTPPPVPPAAEALRSALLAAGYFFPVMSIVYLLVGIACVTDRYVALAAIVLFPVTFNIVLYHAFLVQTKLLLTAFVVVPNAFLAYIERDAYKPLFRSHR